MTFIKHLKLVFNFAILVFTVQEYAVAQTSWLDHYFTPPNGWNVNDHIRTLGDVNGDGKDDLVGFGQTGVYVGFSTGSSFDQGQQFLSNYAIGAGNWYVKKNPRMMGDVNGDGKDDIIGYGNAGVYVSLSTGTGFTEPRIFLNHYYTAANGWSPDQHVRTVGDINGDGKTDLVGFGGAGVFVAFSTGSGFQEPKMLLNNFAINAGGWSVNDHPRVVADVNGDGKDDIIGYGAAGVLVSLSTGSGFSPATIYLNHYFTAANGWNNNLHVRTAGDLNGDGKADLVGFGGDGVFISLARKNNFPQPTLRVRNFAQNAGQWRVNEHVRVVGDVNGDGIDDIVGYGAGAVLVELGKRSSPDRSQREQSRN